VVWTGETVTLVVVLIAVPPQLVSYHFHEAPCPRLPPDKLKVVDCPIQIVVVPFMEVWGMEVSLTVSVKD
jgi:hypothetical protein